MAKKAGSKKATSTEKTVVQETDPLDVSVSQEAVPATKTQVKKQKKMSKTAKQEPVTEQPPATSTENISTTVETVGDAEVVKQPSGAELVSSMLNEFSATVQSLTTQLSTIRTEFKNLTKVVNREMKLAAKSSRRKRTGGNKQPSGFVKPTLITDELSSFLGRGKGTEMARTEVTKEINQYIRDNKLQDSTNGRHINPDKKLSKLLGYKGEETLTYFNLQKYLSPHFVKTTATTTA